MKEKRMICLIPIYGTIIFFLFINKNLREINKFSRKKEVVYLCIMGLLGVIGMLLGGFFANMLNINFDSFLLYIFCVLFVWPLITLPVIEYSRKAEKIINTYYENESNPAKKISEDTPD